MIYKHNGSIITDIGGMWLSHTPVDTNPLHLPPNTIRVKFSSGYIPDMGDTQTLVDSTNNVWDIYKESNDWYSLFHYCTDLLEVLGANTTNVTSISWMFAHCTSLTTVAQFNTINVNYTTGSFSECASLTSIPLFDTSSVTHMSAMFSDCTSLTTVPLFDTSNAIYMDDMFNDCTSLTTVPLFNTSKVTDMREMFDGCTNVQSGALALYQQASSQPTPPSNHTLTFRDCGSNTQTGAAELAQIPSDWK